MGKKPKVGIVKKVLKSRCMCCFKDGQKPDKNCKSCHGTGIYKDYHYVMVIGKVAYDIDTVK